MSELHTPFIPIRLPESHVLKGGASVWVWSLSSWNIHPDIKRTLVSMSERTGMTVSQVTDEVLYAGLIGMQELDMPEG